MVMGAHSVRNKLNFTDTIIHRVCSVCECVEFDFKSSIDSYVSVYVYLLYLNKQHKNGIEMKCCQFCALLLFSFTARARKNRSN